MIIKTKQLIKGMVIFNVIFMLFFANLVYLFKLPTFIKYIPDIINIVLLLYILFNFTELIHEKKLKPILFIILIFIIHSFFGFIFNDYSFINYLWGLRSVFKVLILYFATYLSFEKNDIDNYIKLIHKVYLINFVECIIQYFLLGWKGDYLGGIFSYGAQGGNGPLTVFIAIELTISLFDYFNNKIKISRLSLVAASYLIIAVLAELKFSFLLFIICLILVLVFNKKSLKTIIVSLVSFVMIFQGITLLSVFFPNTKGFFSYENIVEYVSGTSHGYSTANDLSRIRAFDQINDMFFYNNKLKLFGFGLGNCSTGPISKLQTTFYDRYEKTLHYDLLTNAFVYLEVGLIGFLCLLFFFLTNIIKYSKNSDSYFNNIMRTIVIILIMMIWYNEFLLTERAYFVFVLMALPFVDMKNTKNS